MKDGLITVYWRKGEHGRVVRKGFSEDVSRDAPQDGSGIGCVPGGRRRAPARHAAGQKSHRVESGASGERGKAGAGPQVQV